MRVKKQNGRSTRGARIKNKHAQSEAQIKNEHAQSEAQIKNERTASETQIKNERTASEAHGSEVDGITVVTVWSVLMLVEHTLL